MTACNEDPVKGVRQPEVESGNITGGRKSGGCGRKTAIPETGPLVRNPAADCTVVVMPTTAPSEAAFAAMLMTGKTDQSGAWSSATLATGKYFALASTDPIDRSPETVGKL